MRPVLEVGVQHPGVGVEEEPGGRIAGERHETANRFVQEQHLGVDRDVNIGHRSEEHRDGPEPERLVSAQKRFEGVGLARVHVDDRLVGVSDVPQERVEKNVCPARHTTHNARIHRLPV